MDKEKTTNTNQKKLGKKLLVFVIIIAVLAVAAALVLSFTELGTKLQDFMRGDGEVTEYGYDLKLDIVKIPASDITGNVNRVSGTIIEQFKFFEPYSSSSPDTVSIDFENQKEAIEYIGYAPLTEHFFGTYEKEARLTVLGNSAGELKELSLEAFYNVGDINIQQISRIYTEQYDFDRDGFSVSVRTTEDIEFRESSYETESGIICHVMRSSAMESGYLSCGGYITDGGVLYELHVAYKEKDADSATELLHKWAETFK